MFSVVFDMDGTLLDTQRICIPAWDYAGQEQGISGLGVYIPEVCGMNQIGWGGYIKNKFPQLDLEKFVNDCRDYIIKNLVLRLKPGAKELLHFLKGRGVKIGLATGTSRPSTLHHLKEVGIFDLFDAIVCGAEVENGKPAPDIFLKAAQLLGVDPLNCYAFEDSENGVKAATAAGMKCFGIADIKPFSQEVKEIMFRELNSMEEAIPFFENLK